jgi:PAS domain S-box-containing protein
VFTDRSRLIVSDASLDTSIDAFAHDAVSHDRIADALVGVAPGARVDVLASCVAQVHDLVVITEAEPIDLPGPRIVYVNPAFERATGYSAAEVIGQTPRMLQGPMTDRTTLDRVRLALSRWERIRVEVANVTKSGEVLWLEMDIAPVADATGWYTHWIAIERDVTERKLAEERQRQREVQFRALFDAIPVPCALNDEDGRILYVNPSFVHTFGYTVEDIPTLDDWWPRAYPDAAYRRWTRELWSERLEEAASTGRSRRPVEVVITCRDGALRRTTIDVVALPDPFQSLRLVVLNDVTESRRLSYDLAQAISRKDQRHGLALHEGLGQSLAGAHLLLASIRQRASGRQSEELLTELSQVSDLLRDCVTHARTIAETMAPLALRAGDLPFAIERLAIGVRASGLEVEIEIAGAGFERLPLVVADAAYHIVEEALRNAQAHALARRAVVALDVCEEQRRLIVTVRDDGIGIPDAAATGAGVGSMQQRARALSGWLDVDGIPAEGTTIRATLPFEPDLRAPGPSGPAVLSAR